VTAFERVILYGLPIVDRRKVAYDRVRPEEAREIFIRSALVEGELPGRHDFLEHNRELIRRIEELESRTRRRDLLVDEEALFRFYDSRLPLFADVRSLDSFIRDQGGDAVLRMKEEDLLRSAPDFDELSRFPDAFDWGAGELPLRYAFQPGGDEDGITVKIPVHALSRLHADPFEWMVPGLLEEKVTTLLKGLPKNIRKQLVPVGETARRIVERLDFREGSLHAELGRIIENLTGARVSSEVWEQIEMPPHLRMRFEILGPNGEILGAGRSFKELSALASRRYEDEIWEKARGEWERDGLKSWNFGDLPRQIELGRDAMGLTRHACLGLSAESKGVAVRLFPDSESAMMSTRAGLMLLYEFAFGSELRQAMRSCAFPESMASMVFFVGPRDEATTLLQIYLKQELFDLRDPQWPDRARFEATVAALRGQLHAVSREILDEVVRAVQERDAARRNILRFRQMAGREKAIHERMEVILEELEALMPPDFLTVYRRPRIQQLPRYLRALGLRSERAYASPGKDILKGKLVAPHQERAARLKMEAEKRYEEKADVFLDEFRWMIEEFRISVFAPEIKTLFRISEKRLNEKWQEWETGNQRKR
jgi:ATP-dependent helicase HrpA